MVNSVGYVLRFLTKLCRSLLCDNLFSHLPFPGSIGASEKAQEREDGRPESGKAERGVLSCCRHCLSWWTGEIAAGQCCHPGEAQACLSGLSGTL